ncbi:MAG: outer membrane lipoprotein-sorting protein [Phaeodactylibacter sp.]|uniref:outer membrane lipoprotein-sorting protein n=1 Tax=Phaeodactylibacter sp. TaxID=1940289 RepID=UPI0032EEE71A
MIIAFTLLWAVLTAPAVTDGTSTMEKHRQATAVQDLTGQLTYTNISKSGRKQTRTLRQHILRTDEGEYTYNLLLEFISPQDVAGTSTLTLQHEQKDDEQWLYLPALRMSKRISPSKKSDRFMGTEITYEDLSGYLSEPIDDYKYTLMVEEAVNGRPAYKLEALPRQGVRTQYGKRHLWIDKATHLMAKTLFYDHKGKLLKTYQATDIRPIGSGGHYRAHQIKMENVQTGNTTVVQYKDFAINEGVEAAIFSTTWMETR